MKAFCPHSLVRRFRRENQGVTMIEFALILPLLATLLFGMLEISQYVYSAQKVKNATYNFVNLLSQQNQITQDSHTMGNRTLDDVLEPIDCGRIGSIVTVISRPQNRNNPSIECQGTRGALPIPSRFDFTPGGTYRQNLIPNGSAQLNGYQFAGEEQVITVEVQVRYRPILDIQLTRQLFGLDGAENRTLSHFAAARSRMRIVDCSL